MTALAATTSPHPHNLLRARWEKRRLDGAANHSETLARLREVLMSVPLAPAVERATLDFFGPHTRLAVRSSASGEDLDELASAGLYDSLIGVKPTEIADGIRQVWASLWTGRAARSRAEYGLEHGDIHMAVLIQELIEPDISFIMHTADPITGERHRAWAELALGLGETLASAGQPGSAYRLTCDRRSGAVSRDACASYGTALRPGDRGESIPERVDYSRVPLSTDPGEAVTLGRRLGAIAAELESAFGGPQDVEGVVTGGGIYIVQARPQQGLVPGRTEPLRGHREPVH